MKIKDVRQFKDGLMLLSKGFYALSESVDINGETWEEPEEVVLRNQDGVEISGDEEVPTKSVNEVKAEEHEVVQVKAEETTEGLKRDTLEKLSYRELQKIAKDNDILATGKTEDLIDRLLGEEVEEEVGEESIEEIIEPKEEEVKVVTKADKIEQALEGYSEEELADILSSIGESPKGKRQALLAKMVKAVENGLLEIEIDEDVEEEVIEEVETKEEVEMTVPRQRAVAQAREEVREMIKSESLSEEQMNDILAYVYAREGFSPTLPLKEREDMLEEMYVNLVDDEGVSQELETPYEKDGEPACCSKVLRKKANGNLECTVCNQEYEIG